MRFAPLPDYGGVGVSTIAEPPRGRPKPQNPVDFRDLLDVFPAAVYLTDAEGHVTFFNQAAEALAGRTPELGTDKWCIAWRLYTPEGEPVPLDQCPMAVTLRTGVAVRGVALVAERPSGERVPVMPFPTPLFDADGALTGAVNMLVDITDVKHAEAIAARRADEQAALYRFTDRLYRADSEQDVYDAALDAILGALRCSRASILLFDDAGVMQFVASRGLSADYRKAVTGHTPWKPGEPQPEPIFIADIANSDIGGDLKAVISGEGIAALGFIPLVAHGGVIGKFMTYYDAPHDFSAEQTDLALTIARQLGFALERRRTETRLRESEERFRAIVDMTPECVKLVARDGTLLHMNASGLCMIGADALGMVEGQSIYDVIAPEDRERFREFNERVCGGERASLEFDIVALDGRRRHMETHAAPFLHSDGSVVQLAVTRDVTERRFTQDLQRKAASEFRALADNIHQFAWMTDATGWIYWYNQRWFDYTGTTLEEMQGWGWQKVHHPDHVERVVEKFSRAIEKGEPWEDTFPIRSKDGEYRWFLSRALPIRDEGGQVVRWFGTNTDITERLQAEEQRTLLINELNHRVKNTLATVQSLAMQTLRGSAYAPATQALFNSRLAALSRAHDILTLENWQGARLRQVVDQALAPFRTERIDVGGPDSRVTPKQALALSIALHELATNAAKYGALSTDAGRIALAWSEEGGVLHMNWRESGGPPVTPPQQTGFGTRLIERSLANDLGGEARILYLPTGVVAQMSTPLEA